MFKLTITSQGSVAYELFFSTELEASEYVVQYGHTFPQDFTSEIKDITVQLALESAKQAKIDAGKAAREVCQQVLDLVAGDNLSKELSIADITELQTVFASTEQALRAGRPSYAKYFISQIEADGVLVSQELKDACLEILSGY